MLRLGCFALICATAPAQVVREIELTGLGKSEPVVLALNAKGAGCDQNKVLHPKKPWRSGAVELEEDQVEERCRRCEEKHLRVAVFSSENAAVYLDAGEVCEQGKSGRLKIPMREPTTVKLHVWLSSDQMKAQAMDAVANANWVFRRNLAGVQLKADFLPRPRDFPEEASDRFIEITTPKPAKSVSEFCVAAFQSKAYQPGEMNIYFPWRNASETCGAPAGGPESTSNIIVIGGPRPQLGDIPHELGHAFGLKNTDVDQTVNYPDGHTPPRPPGFPPPQDVNANFVDGRPLFGGDNAIWAGSLVLGDAYLLGQIFWMNFSAQSFLARVKMQNNEIRQVLACGPGECVPYKLDSPTDPRLVPAANQRPFLVVDSCPEDVLARPHLEFLQKLFTGFAVATGIRELDKRLAALEFFEEIPRYCRAKDLMDTLDDRYPKVCLEKDQPVQCGSRTRKEFRETWTNSFVGQLPEGIAGFVGEAAGKAFAARKLQDKPCEKDEECRCYLVIARNLIGELVRSGDFKKLRGKRVLWIDEPGANSLERKVFQAFRVEIQDSATNADALQQLRTTKPKFDLVISNFKRPNEPDTANDLLAQIKGRFDTRVVIYSRNVTADNIKDALARGAFAETDDPFVLYRRALEVFLKKDVAFAGSCPGSEPARSDVGASPGEPLLSPPARP